MSFALLFSACNQYDTAPYSSTQAPDITPPIIFVQGELNDTVCLNMDYKDKGASVNDDVDGRQRCTDLKAEVSGTVNTAFTGTYFLHYNASDTAGNRAASVTRTVHVVNNSAAFLAGLYNVACSCTASVKASHSSTVTADNYMATVSPGSANRTFQISLLRIGSEYVMPLTSLSGNRINVGYFSRDYNDIVSKASGTLSATKKTFTIESFFYQWDPTITYTCKNSYTKP